MPRKRLTGRIRDKLKSWLVQDELMFVRKVTVELNDVSELFKLFGWQASPIIIEDDLEEIRSLTDVNNRRRKDAEVLSAVCKNTQPRICLDIGTGRGHSAARMAANAPQARIYTINIAPEDYDKGGVLKTGCLSTEEIGSFYRSKGFKNIVQIYANTAEWDPDIRGVDLAYIDGCHDQDFVYWDTRKALNVVKQSGFILWHDFNLELVERYEWIREVMLGVERLLREGLLKGDIFHVRDSWVGIHRVGGVEFSRA